MLRATGRFTPVAGWLLLLAALATLIGLAVGGEFLSVTAEGGLLRVLQVGGPLALAGMWAVMAALLFSRPLADRLAGLLGWWRRRAAVCWLMLLILLALAVAVWQVLAYYAPSGVPGAAQGFYLLCSLWLLILLTGWGWRADQRQTMRQQLAASRWTNPLLLLTVFVLLALSLELGLRFLYVQTDAGNRTLMSWNWFAQHWGPVNSLGYRDAEPVADLPDGTQRVLVLGDSFVVGHGIADPAATFPQALAERLGAGYAVNVAGRLGWNTPEEWAALQDYPVEPDVLVLSHFINDIYPAASAQDPEAVAALRAPDVPGPLRWFYLPSFLHFLILGGRAEAQLPLISGWYAPESAVWAQHEAALAQFVSWAAAHEARLIVVVWPHLRALGQSEAITRPVVAFFTAQGVPVLDMRPLLADRDPAALVVNPFDPHPNAAVHALAAEHLYALVSR